MIEIARKVFVSLNRDNFYFYKRRYYVLNDGNYVTDFYAVSDKEAIDIFDKMTF